MGRGAGGESNSRENSHPSTITELEEGRETNGAINTKTSRGIAGIHDNKNKIMSGLSYKQSYCWFLLLLLECLYFPDFGPEETNVDEFPLPMVSLLFIFGTKLTM